MEEGKVMFTFSNIRKIQFGIYHLTRQSSQLVLESGCNLSVGSPLLKMASHVMRASLKFKLQSDH